MLFLFIIKMPYNEYMQRREVEEFIHETFAPIVQDYPWEDSPNYSVFRHQDNKKWFALLMTVSPAVLKLPKQANIPKDPVEIINLKCDPDLIETVLQEPGICPAYHMNKHHWITIILEQAAPRTIKNLIELSYNLTLKKSKSQHFPTIRS